MITPTDIAKAEVVEISLGPDGFAEVYPSRTTRTNHGAEVPLGDVSEAPDIRSTTKIGGAK